MKLVLIFFLTLSSVGLYLNFAQPKEVTAIDNEFNRSGFVLPSEVYCNPLLLNGKPLDYEQFNLNSTGELTLVLGNPEGPNPERIPFYVQLRRREGLNQLADLNYLNQSVYSLEVSRVLSNASSGDLLIITPTNPVDWKAKRILLIKGNNC